MKPFKQLILLAALSQLASCNATKEALQSSRQVRSELAKELSKQNHLTPWMGSFKQPFVGHIYELDSRRNPSQLTNLISVYNAERNWNLFKSDPVNDSWNYTVNKNRKLTPQLNALGINVGGNYSAIKDVSFLASADSYDSVQNILGLEQIINDNTDLFPGLKNRLKQDRAAVTASGKRHSADTSTIWIITGVALVKNLSLKITHNNSLSGNIDASEGAKKLLDVASVTTATVEGHAKSNGTLTYLAPGAQKVAVELRPLILEKQDDGTERIVILRSTEL